MTKETHIPKKILFIMESLREGGAEKALLTLLKHFDYTQYHVSLCILFAEGIYWNEVPPQVKTIILYKKQNSFFRKSFRYYKKYGSTLLLKYQIRRKIEQHYDVIISFLEGRSLLFHNIIKKRAYKNITWVHCDLLNYHWTLRDLYNKESEIKYYSNMDKIVFVTLQAMTNFTKIFHIEVPKECIHNLINQKHIRELAEYYSVQNSYLTVTAMGSLFKIKAFDRLIRVAKMFKDAQYPIQFQIIGKGEEELQLKELCDKLNVKDIVIFIGFKRNPYPYLKSSDVFISTSASEGFSLVLCEAMSLGIPVVSTMTAGAVELLENGKYGILTKHDDESIFESLKKLIDDIELREYYKKMSVVRANMFNISTTISKLYNLINN